MNRRLCRPVRQAEPDRRYGTAGCEAVSCLALT
jgi:hypothetical protein